MASRKRKGPRATETKFAKKCAVIYYDSNGNGQNGETLKGLNVLRLARLLFTDVSTFSTYRWKKNPFRAFNAMKKAIAGADYVFLVLSTKGAQFLGKYLLGHCQKRGCKVFYFMVGIGPLRYEAYPSKELNEEAYRKIAAYFHDESLWKKSDSAFSKVLPRYDHVFVECKTIASVCRSIYGANNVSVFPNFRADDELVLGEGNANAIPRFVYFARLTPEKGIFDLIKVMNELAKEGLEFQLDLFGSLQVEGSQIHDAIQTPQIRFCGTALEKQTELLSRYDATVFPTKHFEGMPGTIVESLLGGTPVISSNFTFAKDMIQDGMNGFVYPFGDNEALKGMLRNLIREPDILRKMRKETKEKAKEYLQSSCMNALLQKLK